MPEMGPKTEDDWKAECDANTLADAEAIKADSERFDRAQAAAKRMLEAQTARANALKKLAGDKNPKGFFDKTAGMNDE